MKIVLATPLYPPEIGGPATYAELLMAHLPQRGIEIALVKFSDVRHLPKIIRHLGYFWRVFKAARSADIVYAQDTVSVGLPAALAAWLAGKKFIVRVPGDYAWEQGRQRFGVRESLDAFQYKKYGWYTRTGLLRVAQKFVVRRALRVITPSTYMYGKVVKWVKEPKRVQTIYSSIPMPVFFERPKDRPEGFLICTAARLVPWKGVGPLISAVALHKDWKLVIVGDGPERNTLKRQAQQLGATDRIVFTGQLSHAEAMGWVQSADVFVLNSTYEGLSHVLVEAMALCTPVLATNAGGNLELIGNSDYGLLIPTQDDNALAEGIDEIRKDPAAIKERAVRAQEYVKETFTISKSVRKLVDLAKSL